MKNITIVLLFSTSFASALHAQNYTKKLNISSMDDYEIIKSESHIPGLQIAMTHKLPAILSNDFAVLFLHGSSFSSALSFGYKMNNYSWIDNLAENGYDVYALDFLGYGNSDRYPEMEEDLSNNKPVGRALDVYQDVDKAVDFIIKKTGKAKVYLIGHSWGGSVAALYAAKFPKKIAKLVLFAAITQRENKETMENIKGAFEMMSPAERIDGMENLTPKSQTCQLEPEVFKTWGNIWLQSDPLAAKLKSYSIRFPSGPSQDVQEILHGHAYYRPSDIKAPTLVIRGEWDQYPNHADDKKLFDALENVPYKKYVIVKKGTHVMHLEKSRYRLYNETVSFLKKLDL